LSVLSWAALCVALSVIGSLLTVICLAILNGINFSNPFFLLSKLQLLLAFIGYSLLVNALGAAALMLAFAIRKHLGSR